MSRKLQTVAALTAVLALPLSAASANEASDFGDDVESFFAGAARDIADVADKAEDGAKDTFYFVKDKAEEADDEIDRRFHAPWEK